tara:strand:- start:547 stop:1188 length:642 start_codon:yes stop_codon:yes gene_type:complete
MSEESKYLQHVSAMLKQYAEKIRNLHPGDAAVKRMHELLKEVKAREAALRDATKIGVRFNVLRTQVDKALDEFEQALSNFHVDEDADEVDHNKVLADDEMPVYIYLFNSQGHVFDSWKSMMKPSSIREYSVNRPVYLKLEHVEEVLRAKTPREHHGFVEVIVKKADILSFDAMHDKFHHPLARLKEGALKLERVLRFHVNRQDYQVSPDGKIL